MAIFISRYPRYDFVLRIEHVLERHPATGEVLRTKAAQYARFQPLGRAPSWVMDAARGGLYGTEGLKPIYEREREDPGEDASGKAPMDRPVVNVEPFRLPFPVDDPMKQLGWFDSKIGAAEDGWPDEDHEENVAKMRRFAGPDSFIEVVVPRLAPPWPTYDTLVAKGRRSNVMVAEEIAKTAAATGIRRETIVAYERENLNRPEVLAALETALAVEEPEEELVDA